MKQHITMENLLELSKYQRDRLNDLWIPKRYDLAAGFLCKDAENSEYDVFEFVIGAVHIKELGHGYSMTLMNLEALRDWINQKDKSEEEVDTEEFNEEDFIFEYERPDIYGKEDCMPLLNIGQMLEILDRCGYGNGKLYVNIHKETNTCGIGRDIEQFIDYGTDYNSVELCDALWMAIKEIL